MKRVRLLLRNKTLLNTRTNMIVLLRNKSPVERERVTTVKEVRVRQGESVSPEESSAASWAPEGRHGHAAVSDGDDVVVFGGYSGSASTNEAWRLKGATTRFGQGGLLFSTHFLRSSSFHFFGFD